MNIDKELSIKDIKEKEMAIPVKKYSSSQLLKMCPVLLNYPTLTNKQKAFCWYYVHNGNHRVDACLKAGYKTSRTGKKAIHALQVSGWQLLNHPKIKACIKDIVKNDIDLKKNVLEHNIFNTLLEIINLDILKYVNEDGSVKTKLSDIPKRIRRLIKKVETKYYGKNADVKVLTIDFLGKDWAMDKLIKYIKMIETDPTNINVLANEAKINLLNILQGKKEE